MFYGSRFMVWNASHALRLAYYTVIIPQADMITE